MKQTNTRTNLKNSKVAKSAAAPASAALLGTTGIAIIGAAAIGVAGFFAWKNREKILSFVGNYVDLPESLTSLASSEHEDSEADSESSVVTPKGGNYAEPTVEHRM